MPLVLPGSIRRSTMPWLQRLPGMLLLASIWLFAVPVWRAEAQTTGAPTAGGADRAYAPVVVEGRKILEVSGNAQLSAAARADKINRRLTNLVAQGEAVRPFDKSDLVNRTGETQITLGGEYILSVTDADAQDALSTREELAMLWGGKLALAVADARAARANPLRGAGILIRHSIGDLLVSLVRWLPRLAGALLLWIVFWLLAHFAGWVVHGITTRKWFDANLRQLLRATAFYGTWLVGLVAILSTLGLDSTSIATGLGISGFVLGFAFKDILSHFFAGLMLLLGRQFRIGDQIVVSAYEGTVERIELRALYLRTYDNRLVIIPNGDVFTSAVTSNTASPHRRREFVIGIGYEDDIPRAQQIAQQTARETEGVLPDPAPDVLVEELATSTVNLRVRFYMNSLRADYLRVGSEVMRRVKEAFDREGVSMPTDIQTLVIQNLDEAAQIVAEAKGRSGSGSEKEKAGTEKAA